MPAQTATGVTTLGLRFPKDLRLTKPFREAIRYYIQLDVVFKQRFQTGKGPGEPASRVKYITNNLVSVSLKTIVGNRDVGHIVSVGTEDPFDCGHGAVISPVEQILLLTSISFTSTSIETSYIFHVHVTCLSASKRPVLFVNQNREVLPDR